MVFDLVLQWATERWNTLHTIGEQLCLFRTKIAKCAKKAINQAISYLFSPPPQPFTASVGDSHQHPGFRFLFVNGILNLPKGCQKTAKVIAKAFDGTKVHYTYIPTEGVLSDLARALDGLLLSEKNEAHDLLLANIRERLQELNDTVNGTLVIMAHSAGGLAVEEVCKSLTEEEKSRIHVYTFGSAALLPQSMCQKVKNYVSNDDFIPRLAAWVRTFSPQQAAKVTIIGKDKPVGLIEAHDFKGRHYQAALQKDKT